MEKITVVIYIRNEEKNIAESITSASMLTKQILVIDMESTDDTKKVAENMKVKVISYPFSSYVEPAREFGIRQTKTDWVLVLDADERITAELADEIKTAIRNRQFSNYKIPRKNVFAKIKWLKHGGWWPDYQIRLIRTKDFFRWPKRIHATPQINGLTGFLSNPLVHYFHGNLSNMVGKTIIFEDIESDLLFKAGKNSGTTVFFRKYIAELFRRLGLYFGFSDGPFGIIESIYQAYSKTITYLFLYEKQNQKGRTI